MLTCVNQPINIENSITFEPMLERKYKNTIYFITLTIIVTIAAQVYWNVKNYEVNKQQVANQIQTSFDNAVEKYFAGIAKNDVFRTINAETFPNKRVEVSISNHNYTSEVWIQGIGDTISRKSKRNLLQPTFGHSRPIVLKEIDSLDTPQISIFRNEIDSLDLKQFTSKILFSFIMDDVELKKIDSLFHLELQRKKIALQYGFQLIDKNPLSEKTSIKTYNLDDFPTEFQSVISNSPFTSTHSILELRYTNTTTSILKRMFGSILLSLILSGIIIGCLLFLLSIISKQKQLAEVKNDLISNITHEFKTPIATIGVALESIKDFNVIDDVEKTENYLDISNNQLSKLNLMVEKLLETASLDSDNLTLDKVEVNISNLLQTIVEKHQMQTKEQKLTFNKLISIVLAKVDVFHFENAVNNIIDNAIKYGGNDITIKLNQENSRITISISDNGNSLTKDNKEKIFEQFYRVPKGNTHDIKGFGIGLYYAKKIVEKHQGIITLELNKNLTTFKILLPNE